jgi:hypothetical protein
MQELINKIVAEAGITPEQAQKAFATVVNHVKSILPPAFAGNIDSILASQGATAAAPKEEGMMDKAQDMMDAAKEKFNAFTDSDNLENLKNQAEEKMHDLKDSATDFAKDSIEKLKGLMGK